MNAIYLSDDQRQVLIDLLERELLSLQKEIMHTDTRDYRRFLKERERSLADVLQHVRAQTQTAGAGQPSVETIAPPLEYQL